jgi:hypothetical protein
MARQIGRWVAMIAVTGVLLAGMTWLSAAPIAQRRAEAARLRLSWIARPERIEVCRTLSAAEMAQREEHMRQRVDCEGRFATYVVRVESDGRVVHESVVLEGTRERLHGALDHWPYRDLSHHHEKIDALSTLAAERMFAEGRRASWASLALKPGFEFFRSYVLRAGFLDGTPGRAVILGLTGRNFAAGMSGGVAYVYDVDGNFANRCNKEMVELQPLVDRSDMDDLREMITHHVQYTGSTYAGEILDKFEELKGKFIKVMPRDYQRMLKYIHHFSEEGLSGEDALIAAFEANNKELAKAANH